MEGQKPSVARIAHYVAYGTPGGEFPAGEHRAAIITEVHEDLVDDESCCYGKQPVGLCILNPTGFYFSRHVHYDASGTIPGTWHWPERV